MKTSWLGDQLLHYRRVHLQRAGDVDARDSRAASLSDRAADQRDLGAGFVRGAR
jgi:hypothetical protein